MNGPPLDWKIFRGVRIPHEDIRRLPDPPPWRPAREQRVAPQGAGIRPLAPATVQRGRTFQSTTQIEDMVNAALYLRRPLLVTGKPGSGKSALVDAVSYELGLGEPLRWAVTSRSVLRDALYVYDAVGRLQEQQRRGNAAPPMPHEAGDGAIVDFLRLGPLGTALLPTDRPRALLIDEIDKADLDLPNDLLNILEEGEFEIPELARLRVPTVDVPVHRGGPADRYPVTGGVVRMKQFPFVVFTSNGEREFPPAFLRRCLRLEMPDPCASAVRLEQIVRAHLAEYFDHPADAADVRQRIQDFVQLAQSKSLATDQLLNAVFLVAGHHGVADAEKNELVRKITSSLA